MPEGEETIEADVCIVGSGAGGSVVAAALAERGMDVVVLDAAGYFNESDFAQLEFKAYQEMYWRGGPTPTADGNVSLVAGTTLGGGTTINWTNCLRTKDRVREQWASEHGLDGVDGPDFDGHLDAVWERLGVTDTASDLNGPTAADGRGLRGARLELQANHPQRRPRLLRPRAAGLPRLRRPVRQQAQRRPHLARRRAVSRRAADRELPRRRRC